MTALMRWGRVFTPYNWPQCRHCGRAANVDCRVATCRACDSRVCDDGRECPVCYVGLLRLSIDPCGYAKCDEPAVAKAPRVRQACAAHLDRAKRPHTQSASAYRNRGTVRDYINERIAIRDGAKREQYPTVRYILREESAR